MIKFIDLFAGVGGIRMGFEAQETKCVFTSEFNKFAAQNYEANWNEKPSGDITKIPVNEIPEHNLLVGGFPCQPFSIAGKKQGFADTRGTLFFNIAQILEHHRPDTVFLENVRGLVWHDKGNTFKTVLNILENDLGYNVHWKVLSSRDFGIPQNRERVFIIGFKEKRDFEWPKPILLTKKVWDLLEPTVDDKYTISDKAWAWAQKNKAHHATKGNGFGYNIYDENSPWVHTITCHNIGRELFLKQEGKNPRKFTPREAARLQGYPDSFKFVCSDSQSYKQMGNSVTVPVIRALAQSIYGDLNWMDITK